MKREELEKISYNGTALYVLTEADVALWFLDKNIEPTESEFDKMCDAISDGGVSYWINENLYDSFDAAWSCIRKEA